MKEKVNDYLSFLFYGEDSWRTSSCVINGMCHVTLDVHGLKAIDAMRMIKNTICAIPYDMELEVIHGYNGGTAIKDSIREQLLWDSITGIESPWYNPGVTYINVAGRLAVA